MYYSSGNSLIICFSVQMETISKSIPGITSLMSFRQETDSNHNYSEAIDCSPMVLDLSRKRPASPDTHSFQTMKFFSSGIEPPTSSICSTSPVSMNGSESSDNSLHSEPIMEMHGFPLTPRAKATRPFKAYPKVPLPLPLRINDTESLLDKDSSEAYHEFRDRMLSKVPNYNNATNKNMRRISQSSQNAGNSDPAYWEKRRKNNEAAKRSRDARRAKEDEIAIRCAFLEQENIQLKFRIAALESERRERLHGLVFR